MQFLAWLEASSLSNWILTTSWVYPWTIAFHSIGMGFLVGIVSMIALRTLGIGDFRIAPLAKFLVIVNIAFVVNVVTGLMMFIIDATQWIVSPTFQIKMLLILFGVISSVLLTSHALASDADWDGHGAAPAKTKLFASVALVCWAGAIVAGRMTAYLP